MLDTLNALTTEHVNSRSKMLDRMTTEEFVHLMNDEDKKVALAVEAELPAIAVMIDAVVKQMKLGGRLIYIGAGTSGRLGILDAVECPPTFGTDTSLVIGLIAGSDTAIIKAVEGAEDSFTLAVEDLKRIRLNSNDFIIGLAASGRTPYVIGGLRYAKSLNCVTGALSCNKNSEIGKEADFVIEVVTGPEVLAGSTRLKAGTAQKMILNIISTGAMLGLGKIYKNLMVDLQMTNLKLIERGKGIIMKATNVSYDDAAAYLEQSKNNVKAAIVMIECNCSIDEAHIKLDHANGLLYRAIGGSYE